MGILSFGKKKVRLDKVLNNGAGESASRNTTVEINNVVQLSTGTIITGVLICPDHCYFNGTIEGNIEAKNKLVLGENSEVRGSISAGSLIAKGKINGDIIVKNKTVFTTSSKVTADYVQTGLLEVENGAVLNLSNVSMSFNSDEVKETISFERKVVVENKKNTKKTDEKPKLNSEVRNDNNNDNTFLLQIFQDKEINSK